MKDNLKWYVSYYSEMKGWQIMKDGFRHGWDVSKYLAELERDRLNDLDEEEKKSFSREWICINPEINRYGRQIMNLVFEFKQDGIQEIIDLHRRTKRDIYFSFREKSDWDKAELIFEEDYL